MRRGRTSIVIGLVGALLATALLNAQSPVPVAAAAEARDLAKVRALLRQGADVNAAQADGMTALHWAAMHGDAELATMLLYAGANLRATSRLGGYTPLHLASQGGSGTMIDVLVKAGADVKAPTATGATPLMLAAASGRADAVKRLLAHGADVNAVENAHGQTALMFASALDRAEVVKTLLEVGANPAVTTKIIDLAALTAAPGEEALQQSRGNQNAPPGGRGGAPAGSPAGAPGTTGGAAAGRGGEKPAAPRPPDIPGYSRPYRYNELIGRQGGLAALHFAARQGHAETVRMLVEGGANVNHKSPADQVTPLLIATINGHFDIGKYLIDHGADVNAASDAGAAPLYATLNVEWAPKAFYPQPRAHLQQKLSYLEFMKILLDKGADPNARLSRELWYSSYNFDVLRVDEQGATPFWRAAYASDLEAMKLLVAHGADPHLPTAKPAGRTTRGDGGDDRPFTDSSGKPPVPVGAPAVPPLHASAGVGYGEGFAGNAHRYAATGMLASVKYLVEELGADVNAEDHEGNTAIHHAAARGDVEMILYLVGKGADPTKVNRAGRSTADMANGPVQRVQPYPEALALLLKLGAKNSNRCVSC
jgi:ankyrin repeat protein